MEQHVRDNPGESIDDLRKASAAAWASVENRYGQMTYDNLHWHKITQDVAMAATRSVGWNLGTLRELGGGALDTAKWLRTQAQRPFTKVDAPEMSHRMAYFLAMNLAVAGAGAALQKMLTGQDAQDWRDAFFPRTGGVNASGDAERLALPSYFKDEYAFANAPLQTLGHKAHPLLSTLSQLIADKDYAGTEIYNPNDPVTQKVLDMAKHLGKSVLPFTVQGASKLAKGSAISPWASVFGINPAPGDASRTAAERLLHDYQVAHLPPTRSREAAAHGATLSQAIQAARAGLPFDYEGAYRAGTLQPGDEKKVLKVTGQTPIQALVARAPVDIARRAYEAATPAERAQIGPMLEKKEAAAAKRQGVPLRELMAGLGRANQ
jgi:hypothetical protein